MHTASQIAKQIKRWNLVTVDQMVIERPTDEPLDDVVKKTMVRRGSGSRGGRFRNVRVFFTTSRELMAIPFGDRIRAHPRYPLTAAPE